MGFEIPIDIDYFDHPKTKQLMSLVGTEGDIFPIRLWKWAAAYCKAGELGPDPLYVEPIMGWAGKGRNRTKLLLAMIRVGFIDLLTPDGRLLKKTEAERKTQESGILGGSVAHPGVFVIHDWMEHVGRAVLIYERKKQKQREEYGRKAGILPEETSRIPPTLEGMRGETLSTQEGRGESAAAPPLLQVVSPQEETEIRQTVAAFAAWTHPPDVKKREAVLEMRNLGLSHGYIRDAAHPDLNNPATAGFWDIVKALKAGKNLRPGNGRAAAATPATAPVRENATAYLRPERPDSTAVRKALDEARAKADEKIAALDRGTFDKWKAEAEVAADAQKIRVGRDAWVVSQLRKRAGQEFGIEGL